MKQKYLNPEIDDLLVSPEIMRDPYPIYARLRNEMPVLWSENWQSWVFRRYEDVNASLKDKNLSNRQRQALLFSLFTPEQLERTTFLRTFFEQQDITPGCRDAPTMTGFYKKWQPVPFHSVHFRVRLRTRSPRQS